MIKRKLTRRNDHRITASVMKIAAIEKIWYFDVLVALKVEARIKLILKLFLKVSSVLVDKNASLVNGIFVIKTLMAPFISRTSIGKFLSTGDVKKKEAVLPVYEYK